jgi:hypothetical protein
MLARKMKRPRGSSVFESQTLQQAGKNMLSKSQNFIPTSTHVHSSEMNTLFDSPNMRSNHMAHDSQMIQYQA